jgi:hypothetical protein
MLQLSWFLAGAVAGIVAVALRMRVPGEPWKDTALRPFSGGGPRPGTPR